MSRRRSPEFAWLEGTKVYLQMGSYVIIERKPIFKKIIIAPGDAPRYQVLQLWDQYQKSGPEVTLFGLVRAYTNSLEFEQLAEGSRTAYATQLGKLLVWNMPNLNKPLGELYLYQISNKTIQSAFDQMEPNVARNRRFTYLKVAFSWARQRIDGCEENPVVGLKLMPEPPRTRYVTDEEYDHIYRLASPMLKVCMEAAYLFRLRGIEIRRLTQANLLEHGVLVERTKGSWDGVVQYSTRVEQWVADCAILNAAAPSDYLIHNRFGRRLTKSSMDSMWRRVWKVPGADLIEHFTFHDLKAKGVTDGGEAGHKSPKMREVYDRKNRLEEPTR